MSELLAPFEFVFFRNGLAVAVLAGALCGLIGTFVVTRGMSYLGHGLSHAVFGGAAIGAAVGIPYYPAAAVWGIASTMVIGKISRRHTVRADAAIGVVTTASFALGLVVFARWGQARRSIDAVLFGSILGVRTVDVAVVGVLTLATALIIAVSYRSLLFANFDPEVATAAGVRVARLDQMLMILLALSVLATMQVIGAVLVSATLVIPAATVRLLTNSFGKMLVGSTVLGAASGLVGMMASYHLDIPSGASITLVAALAFVVASTVRTIVSTR